MIALSTDGSWPAGPLAPLLSDGMVHVWRVRRSEDRIRSNAVAAVLSPEERGRAERYRRDRDRSRYIAFRGVLRVLLGLYLERSPCEVVLRPTACEKLETDSGDRRLEFNLAHAADVGLMAFADGRRVGVDIERIGRLSLAEALEAGVASRGEKQDLARFPSEGLPCALTRWLVRKEAVLKAIGCGFSLDGRAWKCR